eukprot:1570913-Pleurochrysis_carterae.AAC.1
MGVGIRLPRAQASTSPRRHGVLRPKFASSRHSLPLRAHRNSGLRLLVHSFYSSAGAALPMQTVARTAQRPRIDPFRLATPLLLLPS